ncbi:amino acid adenylation protein [Streptomyces badius]
MNTMGVPMAGKSRLSPTEIWPWSAPGGGKESGIAELRLAAEELLDRLSAVGPPTAVLLAAHAKVVSALSARAKC